MRIKIAQPSDMPCAMMDRRGKDWRGAAQKTRVIMDDGESLCLPINRVIYNIYYINFHRSKHGASVNPDTKGPAIYDLLENYITAKGVVTPTNSQSVTVVGMD